MSNMTCLELNIMHGMECYGELGPKVFCELLEKFPAKKAEQQAWFVLDNILPLVKIAVEVQGRNWQESDDDLMVFFARRIAFEK